jgi:hypothetical protein
MRGICCLLLAFLLLTACDSKVSGNQPFDPAAELIFTKHARCRMDCRHITAGEIHEILEHGSINYAKSEPEARPDPKYAVEGYTDEKQHLRIIVAPEHQKLVVITCMELGVEWSCHCN